MTPRSVDSERHALQEPLDHAPGRACSSRYPPDELPVDRERRCDLRRDGQAAEEEAMVSRLISAVEENIATAPIPAEQGAWEKVRDGILVVPQQVLVDVLTNVVTD